MSGFCFPRVRRIILWVRLTLRGEEYLDCLSHGVVVEMGYLQAKTRCGEGDVLKSNKWLAMVKIEQVVGCANENLILKGENLT